MSFVLFVFFYVHLLCAHTFVYRVYVWLMRVDERESARARASLKARGVEIEEEEAEGAGEENGGAASERSLGAGDSSGTKVESFRMGGYWDEEGNFVEDEVRTTVQLGILFFLFSSRRGCAPRVSVFVYGVA